MELTLGVDVGCGQSSGELRRKALKASRAGARGTVAGLQAEPQAEPSCRGPGPPAEKLELSVGKAVSPTAYFGMRKNVPALRFGSQQLSAGSSSGWSGTYQEAIGMHQALCSGHTGKSGYRNENEVR